MAARAVAARAVAGSALRGRSAAGSVEWAGVVLSVTVALWAALLVYLYSVALADVNPWLAPVTNLVAVGGLAPAVRNWRGRPALRFVAAGLGAGVALGWSALLVGWLAG